MIFISDDFPGVYTQVSYFLNWISNTMNENEWTDQNMSYLYFSNKLLGKKSLANNVQFIFS